MQDMFSSTWPVSLLNLRGDNQDDADLCPTLFSGETQDDSESFLVDTEHESSPLGNDTEPERDGETSSEATLLQEVDLQSQLEFTSILIQKGGAVPPRRVATTATTCEYLQRLSAPACPDKCSNRAYNRFKG